MAKINKAAENNELFVELGIAACDAGDYAKAIEWFGKAVEQRYAPAQLLLGVCYKGGNGVPQNYAKAVEWFSKAAEQGYAPAQYELGLLYANGRGVAQDEAKAAEWFSKAAAQGHARSQFYMGLLSQDNAKTAEWYGKAAEQGDADAQYELGILYVKGEGVPEDSVKADELLHKAAAQGHAEAKDLLAKVAAEKKAREAKEAAERAAAQAAERLQAAEQGDANAQFNLGRSYFTGQGVTQDNAKAVEWFRKAAAQGHAEAKDWLNKEETKKAKEKRRKIGRVIALILVVFPILFLIAVFAEGGGSEGGAAIVGAIGLSLFFSIPFLVLYFSGRERKILRGIFLGVGVLLTLLLIGTFTSSTSSDDMEKFLFFAMCISYIASFIMAMIFPKD